MTGRFRMFPRRVGRDVSVWPTLALLLLVVLVAIGCVLWFMREAMRNEQMAVREKLTEAYRGHLTLVRAQAVGHWQRWRAQLDGPEPPPARFARCVNEGLADSVICFDEQSVIAYPRAARPPDTETAKAAATLQTELRELFQSGRMEEAVQLVIEKFADGKSLLDGQGRLLSASAELLALESLGAPSDPRFRKIATRLRDRANDYATDMLPSSQRRFVMSELQRLDPGTEFATHIAEDLAARFLEANPIGTQSLVLTATELRGVWSAPSASGRTLALLSTDTVRTQLGPAIRNSALPRGASITVLAPAEDASLDPAPIVMPVGADLPGWRFALSLDDMTLFDVETAKRLKLHVIVACAVIAAMSALAIVIARSFGQQVALARLKNDLVATVSHELKTPLTAMRALVETLLDAEKFDEKTTREYLQLLATENSRLSRLIENFLTFSRLERNKFTFDFADSSPAQIVQNAVAAFGERAHQPHCMLEVKIAPDLPVIRADADALATALLNLLDNAWKYSGDEKHLVLRADRYGGRVRFSVEDNGLGLSSREQSRVFQRFYQADQRLARTVGGCGLGLSIVSSIVEAHGGHVGVSSEVGHGSTFTFEIPA